MPPTSGQGTNQAFEDGWTLAAVLACIFKQIHNPRGPSQETADQDQDQDETGQQHALELKSALNAWHQQRQTRINRVSKLTQQMNNLRLPVEEQQRGGLERVRQWQWAILSASRYGSGLRLG
ncbi:uncharacterized protein Z518_09478 [Rhinocladiella mackenziei CBS 650.93]|uniref:Uncharacterized protein n=1 Tax=Rhinocladiella mackenziei CBS 650.93 TaxID=1442369 RepID=A0A0D2IER1_9EURO|nr:uncharacterized protein Z518_09478 [Rhinocladiella mackenziei CBS 650.93]KIX01751.1 hypothetical protein Z518_09478 [Rhinocladiella mackenziei CBS 650.93]